MVHFDATRTQSFAERWKGQQAIFKLLQASVLKRGFTIDMEMISYSYANKTHFQFLASFWKWEFLELGNSIF